MIIPPHAVPVRITTFMLSLAVRVTIYQLVNLWILLHFTQHASCEFTHLKNKVKNQMTEETKLVTPVYSAMRPRARVLYKI